jgi:mannan endo-1,4-beta-mannosidase
VRKRLKWLGGIAALITALGAGVVITAGSASAATGITVSGTKILESNGNPFVMRGVSHAHVWYPTQTSSFANIKATGANTVRVVLGSGKRWGPSTDVPNVVSLCKTNKLICVLEVHDTTGYGEEGAAATLDEAVNYWITQKANLVGQESYVIINIGNEPYGNTNATAWTAATTAAIQKLRSNGFQHAIMVDAPNWGQDWQFVMRDNAAAIFAADPQKNTIFSIHMYGVFDTAAEVTDYLGKFQTANLPLVVGEFGINHSDGNPDEDTIMATAQQLGVGYIGWSWSGNGGGVEYLDMTTSFNPAALTEWGERIINGANGIKATSKEATIYGGGSTTTAPTTTPTTGPTTPPTTPPTATPSTSPPWTTPTTPPTTTPASGGCTATYAVNSSWGGGFQGTVTVTAGSAAIKSWKVSWTWPNGQRISNAWNAAVTSSGDAVSATNMSYNGSLAAGSSTSWGFLGSYTGTNTAPTVACAAA